MPRSPVYCRRRPGPALSDQPCTCWGCEGRGLTYRQCFMWNRDRERRRRERAALIREIEGIDG